MAMNNLVKKAAVKKYAPLVSQNKAEADIKAAIAADEKKYTEEEVAEIYAAISNPISDNPLPPVPEEPEAPKAPTLSDRLSGINYRQLTGETFKAYNEIENSLLLDDLQDFECYRSEPVMQERYPGLPQTPVDFVGIRIKDYEPVSKTRIEVKHAKELNRQLANSGRYYLLKK